MKKILFVSALASELKIVKQEIKKLDIKKNLEINFLESGMGNYNTIFNLTKYLEKNKADFIVNIGVCGWEPHPSPLLKGEGIYKFIQIGRIKNLANNKELIVPIFFEFGKVKSIACSEKIITSPLTPLLKGEGDDINFVDMESYGVEFVSEKYNIPRIILKVPVDKIGEETKNFDYKKAKKYLAENINYKKLFDEIGNFLETLFNSLLQEGDKEKFFKKISFSESQKIIFEKLFNKYEVLVGDDFEKYFKNFWQKFENKKIQKNDIKKFLRELEEFLEDK